jgi:hypothetical protein
MGAWLPEGSSLFDPITWICNGTLFLRRNNTARNVFLSARVPVADASLSASSGMVISALSATLSKIKRAMLTRSRFMSRRSSRSWWTEGYAIRHGSRMPTLSAFEPDRRLPDLVNGACAAYVHHVACQQLGIVPPKGSAYSKRIPPLRAIGSFAMRSTHSVVRPMRSGRGKRSDVTPRYIRAASPGKLAETLIPQPRGNRQFRRKNSRSGRR